MATEYAQNNAPEILMVYCRDRIDRIRKEVDFLRDMIAYLESKQDERNLKIFS